MAGSAIEALVISIGALAGGLAVAVVGALGWRGKLPRNRLAGIRTPATMRSDQAFQTANRAGGPLVTSGGLVAVLAGAAGLGLRAHRAYAASWGCALAGVIVMALLAVAGGVIGSRRAGQ